MTCNTDINPKSNCISIMCKTQLKSLFKKKKKKPCTHIQHSNNLLFLYMKKKVIEHVSQHIQNITKIYY